MAEKVVNKGFSDFKDKNIGLKIGTFFSSRKQVHEIDFECDRIEQMAVLADRAEQMTGVSDRAEQMFFKKYRVVRAGWMWNAYPFQKRSGNV